jgi:2-polyprenyl-3-methyl-5-hydroxy-6-metoxy-1,4-benzoquinol methylase
MYLNVLRYNVIPNRESQMNWFRRLSFNLWYFRQPPWDTSISPPELLDHIQNRPPGRALDLGCGSGTNAITLAQHSWQVTGVDFAPRAIKLAKQKAKRFAVQVDFQVDEVTSLRHIKGPFDLILDIGCYHSLPENRRSDYLRQVVQMLAKDGTYLLYVFVKKDPATGGPGITDEELKAFERALVLEKRVDGTERGRRPSAWLWFRAAS